MSEQEQGHSPVPEAVEDLTGEQLMSFFEALEEVSQGLKVTRKEWNNDHYCFLDIKSEQLMIHGGVKGDDKDHQWIVSKGDMMAEDWVIVF